MKATLRQYNHDTDYQRVGEFLVKTYRTSGGYINWLQPRWEYMHYHPYIRRVDLSLIGIWEVHGEIVAVVHPEHSLGTAYFQIEPGWENLKSDILKYAEKHLTAMHDGLKYLRIYINDNDEQFRKTASDMGYVKTENCEEMSHFIIPDPFPSITLSDGFRLKSLKDDNNLYKLDSVLWRGFGHGDEPPDESIEDQKFMQRAPNYNLDLQVVVEAPDSNFVSYCGMWYESVNRIAYVEPVATDPDFRRMGLASAAVLEGIRRCGELGATEACVGAIRPVYLSIGFRQIFNCSAWRREWM